MGLRHALVTVAIGSEYQALAKLTHPLMAHYAEHCGMDFRPIVERSTEGDSDFEKLAAYRLLDEYERLLIVDTDVLITNEAPNILDVVPVLSFGAYLVSVHTPMHDPAIALIQRTLRDIGWKRDYFNAGVMVASRAHQALFDPDHPDLKTWLAECARQPEHKTFLAQTYLNFRVRESKTPFFDITYRYNHSLGPGRSGERFGSYFIHCKGHRKGSKLTEIERARFVLDRPMMRAAFVQFPALTRVYDKLL